MLRAHVAMSTALAASNTQYDMKGMTKPRAAPCTHAPKTQTHTSRLLCTMLSRWPLCARNLSTLAVHVAVLRTPRCTAEAVPLSGCKRREEYLRIPPRRLRKPRTCRGGIATRKTPEKEPPHVGACADAPPERQLRLAELQARQRSHLLDMALR